MEGECQGVCCDMRAHSIIIFEQKAQSQEWVAARAMLDSIINEEVSSG